MEKLPLGFYQNINQNMKINFKFLYFLAFSFSFFQTQAQNYQFAESTEYDPVNNQWLSSNGNTIIADDGLANLSYFGTSSATHGMEVMDATLFAIDGNILRAFSLNTEDQISSVTIAGSSFLNGITTDGDSTVYMTDFSGKKIYRVDVSDISNMTYDIIVNSTGSTPNGIVFDGENNRLIFVNWGSNAAIKAVDLTNNSVSTIITTNLGNIDGIDDDNDGNYYISSWSPARITKYDKDFANPPETITTPFISNPADIGYSKETDTLAIPIGNDVVFVGFESDTTTSVQFLQNEEIALTVFPNPVTDQSYIEFELENDLDLNLQIMDNQGRLIKTLLTGSQPSGKHKVLLAGSDLPSGIYHLSLQTRSATVTRKLVIP